MTRCIIFADVRNPEKNRRMKMKKIGLVWIGMMAGMAAGAGRARAADLPQCDKAAIEIARSIRLVEMPESARRAEFSIVSSEVTEDFERYLIRMKVDGRQPMSDQRLVMVGGATCILAGYDMPGAG